MTMDRILGVYSLIDIACVIFMSVYMLKVSKPNNLKAIPLLGIVVLLAMPLYVLIFGIKSINDKLTIWVMRRFYHEQVVYMLLMSFLLSIILFYVIVKELP